MWGEMLLGKIRPWGYSCDVSFVPNGRLGSVRSWGKGDCMSPLGDSKGIRDCPRVSGVGEPLCREDDPYKLSRLTWSLCSGDVVTL